jgi:hypothetical protein
LERWKSASHILETSTVDVHSAIGKRQIEHDIGKASVQTGIGLNHSMAGVKRVPGYTHFREWARPRLPGLHLHLIDGQACWKRVHMSAGPKPELCCLQNFATGPAQYELPG